MEKSKLDLNSFESKKSNSSPLSISGKSKGRLFTFIVVILLLGFAALIFAFYYRNFSLDTTAVKGSVVPEDVDSPKEDENALSYSTDTPSEEPIPQTYSVAPEDPLSISLPDAGIEGFIQNVGIDQNNEIAVPENVFLAGWYVNSSKPGEKGLSIIDGHVDGPTRGGIFANLVNVKVGELVEIEYGNGSKVSFEVVDVVQVDVDEAYDVLFAKRPEFDSQLNLITCGGDFDSDVGSYVDRVIVVAERI